MLTYQIIYYYDAGILGLQLEYSMDEEAHIKDSVHIVAQALSDIHKDGQNLTEAPGDCDADTGSDDVDEWESGEMLLEYVHSYTWQVMSNNNY